ncbi:MAG: hypothetical protein L6R38_002406 [Xanthoria sp. 2 TBL-2021]|nr:MAG: hypothetical protein L6R38_002406 [Xanthoria sp. 2 TBL-2021]
MQELWYWVEEREAYRSDYAKLWNDSATAVDQNTGELGGMADTAKYCSYTSQWNLLDYPAVSFPVDKVDKRLDGEGHRSEFLGQLDWENWELCKTAVPLKEPYSALLQINLVTAGTGLLLRSRLLPPSGYSAGNVVDG